MNSSRTYRPLALPVSVFEQARQVAAEIGRTADQLGGRRLRVLADEIITGRAALLDLPPPDRISSGGATRLIRSGDGWFALTLSRLDDVEAVPALVESDAQDRDPWEVLTSVAAHRSAGQWVARARLLGMPAAVLGEVAAAGPRVTHPHQTARHRISDLLVVDLSSMWAGPLCARLLAAAGATVVKLETAARPDGTRGGNRRFFDWVNAEKLCFAADLGSEEVAQLLRVADVVIEGSRPAALARRALSAEHVPARPGRVWLRVSGYGPDWPERIAFGDDAAVAGGLVSYRDDGPVFCGDAIADPLTGLVATAAVLEALCNGGGTVLNVAMAEVAATYAVAQDSRLVDVPPRAPTVEQRAHDLGADNARVRDIVAAA